ncbi:ATP-binding cassette domain-containing protein [Cupriavidus sp. D384]|uniref:ABC transporter ATP-binding protein n=1 Tax=Cupriavidus sp. D384 TaxID=1538095 RepID=UPI000836BD52|nr:ATP-binding cassette domain-containing protein [Cupriavidus sp. D384]
MDGQLHIQDLTGHGRGPYTFDVTGGKCTVLSGSSGSGKSLLLRMIADLDPSDGTVRIGSTPREALSGPAWRREVTYVAAESGWWADDVLSHFDEPGLAGTPDHPDTRLARLARQVGLRDDILAARVSHLSTGERQRLALLRAIVRRPRFLLLDEPTSALDHDTTLAVEAVLREVMAEGVGLLVVSHNTGQAARLQHAHWRLCPGGLEPVHP